MDESDQSFSDNDDEEFGTSDYDASTLRTTPKYMVDLPPFEEDLSADHQRKMTMQYAEIFAQQNPLSNLTFSPGTLKEAIEKSCRNASDPRPLILYIRNDRSINDNVFCLKYLLSEDIVNLFNQQFIVWPWDITHSHNYHLYLRLLIEQFGSELVSKIASNTRPDDQYPLLVCLCVANGRFDVVQSISGDVPTENMLFGRLCKARELFDNRNNQQGGLEAIPTNKWFISDSGLTAVTGTDEDIQKSLKDLELEQYKIVRIEKVKNIMWSLRYSSKKKQIDDRIGHSRNEQVLFYGCPSSMAYHILNHGFSLDTNQIHDKQYGRGLVFSSNRKICEKYPSTSKNIEDRNALIRCRVLVGKCCTDGSDQDFPSEEYDFASNVPNTVVIRSNEQILPEYLIIYN